MTATSKKTPRVKANVTCPECKHTFDLLPAVPVPPGIKLSSEREARSYAAFMLAPITRSTKSGNMVMIKPRRKMAWWLMLKGVNMKEAMRRAGFAECVCERMYTGRLGLEERAAVRRYFGADALSRDYIRDRLVKIIEESKDDRAKVSALTTAAKVEKLFATAPTINVSHMPVQLLNVHPQDRWCPRCGALTEHRGGTIALPKAKDRAQLGAGMSTKVIDIVGAEVRSGPPIATPRPS